MHYHSMHTYIISKSKIVKKMLSSIFLSQNVVINFKQRDSDSDIWKRHPPPSNPRFRIDGFCVNIILLVQIPSSD